MVLLWLLVVVVGGEGGGGEKIECGRCVREQGHGTGKYNAAN